MPSNNQTSQARSLVAVRLRRHAPHVLAECGDLGISHRREVRPGHERVDGAAVRPDTLSYRAHEVGLRPPGNAGLRVRSEVRGRRSVRWAGHPAARQTEAVTSVTPHEV